MSLLSVEKFERMVNTGMDEDALQDAIDREEAELAHLLGGPLSGERTEELTPGAGYPGPVYLSRYADTVTEVTDRWYSLDDPGVITTYRLVEDGGAIIRTDMSWGGIITVKYTPPAGETLRIERALIELVRNAVVPDRDREAGTVRDDRYDVSTADRGRLIRGLRPHPRNGTIRIAGDFRPYPFTAIP